MQRWVEGGIEGQMFMLCNGCCSNLHKVVALVYNNVPNYDKHMQVSLYV